MAFRFLLLALPVLTLARIKVNVAGKFDEQPGVRVYFSGNQVDVISDQERSSFNLSDNNLKNGANAYFGKRPHDIYLRSPTPWGDLFLTNNWTQVSRILVPKSGRVLNITSKPLIVMQKVFENNSTKDATFNIGISTSVENTVTSSWSKGGELSVRQDINYGFDIQVADMGSSTSFSYSSSWGINTEKSQSVTIGASSAMEVVLKPGQSVITELLSTRGTIQIEIEYEASLFGAVAVNYDDGYRGHHFWALDINAIMLHGNLKKRIVSKEIIEMGLYSQSKVVVRDGRMGHQLIDDAL